MSTSLNINMPSSSPTTNQFVSQGKGTDIDRHLFWKRVGLVALGIIMCVTAAPMLLWCSKNVRQWFAKNWEGVTTRANSAFEPLLSAASKSTTLLTIVIPTSSPSSEPKETQESMERINIVPTDSQTETFRYITDLQEKTAAVEEKTAAGKETQESIERINIVPTDSQTETFTYVTDLQEKTAAVIDTVTAPQLEKADPIAPPSTNLSDLLQNTTYKDGCMLKEVDNEWLIKKMKEIKKELKQTNRYLKEESALYSIIMMECQDKNDFNLANHFKNRTLTASDVATFPKELISLVPASILFSIIDLLSEEQVIQILEDKKSLKWLKISLYYFNPHIGKLLIERQRRLLNVPLEDKIKKAADEAFKNLQRFKPAEMTTLIKTESYQELEGYRTAPSNTLANQEVPKQISELFKKNWDNLNQKLIADGLKEKLSVLILEEINTELRNLDDFDFDTQDVEEFRAQFSALKYYKRAEGLRMNPTDEVTDPKRRIFYPPSTVIKEEIDKYVDWFNDQLEKCDKGTENPIVFAAAACQKLVSIHPFMDANGRTARFVADLILRRYGFLPVAWKEERLPVQIVNFEGVKSPTPTDALECLLEGLKRSYDIVNKVSTHLQDAHQQVVSV